MLKERVLGPKAKLKSAPSPLKTFLIAFWTNFGPIAFYTPLQRSVDKHGPRICRKINGPNDRPWILSLARDCENRYALVRLLVI